MANQIKVNTTRLGTDAEQVRVLISNMEKQINEMKSIIDQFNNMWEGPAKQAFVQAFTDDWSHAQQIISELRSVQSFETQAKDKYEKCEQQVAALVDSIQL